MKLEDGLELREAVMEHDGEQYEYLKVFRDGEEVGFAGGPKLAINMDTDEVTPLPPVENRPR